MVACYAAWRASTIVKLDFLGTLALDQALVVMRAR
jgi:hypothetical protein